ncbi:MAG: exosortase U [Planctomycetes bacterium]|nr:exosortase U [Planctomycetota bacterium]
MNRTLTTAEPGTAVALRPALPSARAALGPPVLVALGFAPLVLLQARSLWDRPQLQAFPLAVAGGVVLAWLAARSLGPLTPGSRGLALAGAGLSGAVLVAAGLTAWPWLGTVAAMAALLAAAFGLGSWRLVRAVLPAWAFVALAVLPPNRAEQWLVTWLQTVVTDGARPILQALRLVHVTEGNVVRVPGRALFVEEACSGVRSLLVVLGGTLFFVLRGNHAPVRGALLLLAAVFWVVVGNIARVVAVVVLLTHWGIEVSGGVRHEVLGLVVLAGVLGLTASSGRLLRALPDWHWWSVLLWLMDLLPIPFTLDLPDLPEPVAAVEDPRLAALPALGATWLGSWPVAAVFGLLGLAQVFWLWPVLGQAATPDQVVARLGALDEETLPARLGTATRSAFTNEDRETDSDFGNHSKVWRYQVPGGTAVVSVDYPFHGWHELTHCYQSIGWTVRERAVLRGKAGVFVAASLRKPDGRPATLLFGLDGQDGEALEVQPSGGLLAYLHNRLARFDAPASEVRRRLARSYRGYQVQVLLDMGAPLSPEGLDRAARLFDDVRTRVRARAKLGPAGPEEGS